MTTKSTHATDGLLQELRDQAKKRLTTSCDNDDLDFLVKSVKALIVTNNEIWQRCQEEGLRSSQSEQCGDEIIMGRYCYEKVQVQKLRNQPLIVTSNTALVVNNFGCLPALPKPLTSTIVAQESDGILPNYHAYFEMAALFEDRILMVILNVMQKHLEEVQVFLGGIEEWLSKSQSIVDFLNELFETNLKAGSVAIEEESQREKRTTSDMSHNYTTVCVKCLVHKSCHRVKRCPNREVGAFYIPAKTTVLSIDQGANLNLMEFAFDMELEEERKKLQSAIGFVKLYDSTCCSA